MPPAVSPMPFTTPVTVPQHHAPQAAAQALPPCQTDPQQRANGRQAPQAPSPRKRICPVREDIYAQCFGAHIHVLTEVKREYENKVLELTNKLEVDLK
ncbi:hypothetical protein SDRG_17417 [Saprolegnia diclina VS20]|uniref:Uncharacterized protein n=1 Tax=Saprolegnia diclina (strain VS20) TaxID=1156394 RepID=T0PR54_SAPDV|nr:hypothetical protein SDRG_17417 [Saprolegnia diclina VS20]EQC24691.1 hypothetical protein SDRG_17417 [Saprolegnia diclina VS20]|eukprot:XP_008621881.1 hypothetical protein SDRG_17417 [Saprolegnia diclina VS20]